jgi:hypothetical protein
MFRELQDSGVCASADSLDLKVSADGSGMKVSVQPGFHLVRGHAFLSTAVEVLTIAAADTATRIDRVILRLDPTANGITLAVLKGSPGAGAPAMTQTTTDIYEVSLGLVTVGASVTNIAASAVADDRRFVGTRIGTWTTDSRPATPRLGRLGLNRTTSKWEFWDGTAWADLAPVVSWTSITDKPATFPPAPHTHVIDYNDVVNKPLTFAPVPHQHSWNSLADRPTEFPPSSHTHAWSAVTSKPSTFPPDTHYHGQYLDSNGTIRRSNGSDRPHSYGPAGSGYYAVWVDGNHDFCRNTSSIKYKKNVRDYAIDPAKVLALQPRVYDRKDTERDGIVTPGQINEYGLIAEEVDLHVPEIVVRMDGEIDTVRYDLLGLALLDVVKDQQARIERLERLVEQLAGAAE